MANRDNNYDIKEYNMKVYDYGPVKGKSEYYKKVVKTTTTTTVNIDTGGPKKYTSTTNKSSYSKANGYGKQQGVKIQRSNSFQKSGDSNKEKFTYSGRIKEKNNYVYYVSGIGYVSKNDENKNNNQKKKEIKVVKNKPKPQVKPRPRPEPIVITIKKEDTGKKELIDNYQYHETKDIKRQNKKSIVTHRRLSDPFYGIIHRSSKQRYSSYTQQPRGYKGPSSLRTEYEVARPTSTLQTVDKFNIRTQKIPGEDKYNYYSSKYGSQSSKRYNTDSNSTSKYNANSNGSSKYKYT